MFGLPEIAVSMAGFVCPGRDDARTRIDAISSLGVRGIVLDAMLPGMRARELTRSARRDIASTLRRAELELVGLDLWIPAEHFSDPSYAQRAIDATVGALELSTELTGLVGGRSKGVVSVVLPDGLSESTRAMLGSSAQKFGCQIADHALLNDDEPTPGVGVGIDPVFYLTAGQSPGKAITRAGDGLVSAHLCDTSAMGRCVVGATGGKLDVTGYAGALIVSGQEWVTVDVRELHEPRVGAEEAITRWRDAGTI